MTSSRAAELIHLLGMDFATLADDPGLVTSGLPPLKPCRLPERGARIARREKRAYWAYVSDEQRREPGSPPRVVCAVGWEPGCPARQAVLFQRRQATRLRSAFPHVPTLV